MLAAPDAPGQVPAGGSPRAALLNTHVVAGLGHRLAGSGHSLKVSKYRQIPSKYRNQSKIFLVFAPPSP